MFKKKCSKCGKKINKNYDFCPYCGNSFFSPEKEEKDYGLLGKKDIEGFDDIKMPFGFNFLTKKLFKELDKQLREGDINEEMFKERKPMGTSISISFSSSDGQPKIKVKEYGKNRKVKKLEAKKSLPNLQNIERLPKKYSKLPKKEAETKVRRLSNKIVYEINLPGVNSIKDILINKLENSIEIKAFSKDKAYFKLLPINLDILNYNLKDEKLILELAE